jgi:hypothetical protein
MELCRVVRVQEDAPPPTENPEPVELGSRAGVCPKCIRVTRGRQGAS